MDKHPQALAQAYKKCKGKIEKIRELGIKPESTPEELLVIVEATSKEAAKKKGVDVKDVVDGQQWYIEMLHEFSKKSTEKQFLHEYNSAFADTASEEEMLDALKAL